jgi:LacI family transcriptional regulator
MIRIVNVHVNVHSHLEAADTYPMSTMTPSANERISITQVAEAANVSIQTVSRVINEQPGVSIKTRERVLKVIEDLGYYPSRAAKAMRGASRTLGIVGYGLEFYGPSRTLIGAQGEARRRNYGTVLELVQEPENLDVRAIFESLLSNHVDGIVWCIPDIGSNVEQVVAQLERVTIPLVFTDTSPGAHDLLTYSDNFLGGQIATRHLVGNGHQQIGLIAGPLTYLSARERRRGWEAVLREAGLTCHEGLMAEGDWGAHSGASALRQLVERNPQMTAIFASNDQMALGAMYQVEQLGLRVPHDLAVIGYDDIPEAAFFHPALSSIRQDIVGLGSAAVSQVIDAIESMVIRGVYTPEAKIMHPELVIRASSG